MVSFLKKLSLRGSFFQEPTYPELSPKFFVKTKDGELNETILKLDQGIETRGIDLPYFYVKEHDGLKKYGGTMADRQLQSIARELAENEIKRGDIDPEPNRTNLDTDKGQNSWRDLEVPPGASI
jgi:hypothetical protein